MYTQDSNIQNSVHSPLSLLSREDSLDRIIDLERCRETKVGGRYFLNVIIPTYYTDVTAPKFSWANEYHSFPYYEPSFFPRIVRFDGCNMAYYWNKERYKFTISLSSKSEKESYMMPDYNDLPFVFSVFINKILSKITAAFEQRDFSEVAREFFYLYSGDNDFISKFILCKEFPQDVGTVIQNMFVFESQPLVNQKKLLQPREFN